MMQFIYGKALQGLGNIIALKTYNINIDHIVSLHKEEKTDKGTQLTATYTLYIATVKYGGCDVNFSINESDYNKLLYLERD